MTLSRLLRPGTLVIAVAALIPLTAACGDDAASPDLDATVATGPVVIDQDSLAFKPGKATVASGSQVAFTNSETALHTVTINGKNASGSMRKGDSFTWTAEAPGAYKITCDFHPQMRATITVR